MEKTRLVDTNPGTDAGAVFRPLSTALGTTGVAINYYERPPGSSIGYCYHRHHEQEEVFVVLSGTATFDTEDGDVAVESGELIRFAPGEWQQGWNRGDTRLEVLALGAPHEQGPTDLRRDCPACGELTPAVPDSTDEELVFDCDVCGVETGRYTL